MVTRIEAFFIAALCGVSPLRAAEDEDASVEYAVKAAFLFNFMKFVEWPPGAFEKEDSPVILGVLGKDPFGSVLDSVVENRSIGKRKINVKRFSSVKDLVACHLLFIAASQEESRSEIGKALSKRSVLTVAEFPDFAEKEGIIQFEKQDRKVRLAINVDNAKDRRLKISANLLRLARIVKSENK
jgi:hypothetical protein